jgi:hypothetical protein
MGVIMADAGAINTLSKLPEFCLSRDRLTGRVVTLVRGKRGSMPPVSRDAPELFNQRKGLTYEQVDAMEYGSTLGFHVPLADPDYVRQVRSEFGQPVGPIQLAPPPGVSAEAPASGSACDPALDLAVQEPAAKPAGVRDTLADDGPGIELLPEFLAA